MWAGRGKAALANPALPEAPPPQRRRWVVAGIAAVVTAAVLAAFGGVIGGAIYDLAGRLVGGGRVMWSEGDGPWREVSRALLLRTEWGKTDAVLAPQWQEAAPGLALAEMRLSHPPSPLSVELVLVRIDPAKWQFRVWGRADWSRAPVRTLAKEAGLTLAVNGPYFAEKGPIGLVVSDGISRNRQASKRAAHFLVGAGALRPRIVNQRNADVGGVVQGFQGFPGIMTGGRTYTYLRTGGGGFPVRVAERRTAACITRNKMVVLLVTDTLVGGVSLSELATVLGALDCVDAMAFDGGASTAMSVQLPGAEREVQGYDSVPVILGVSPR